MIISKTITCFGSSYSAGGGYYFDNINKLSPNHQEYLNSMNEYPKRMNTYSYFGQLEKIFRTKKKHKTIFKNLAKCAHGNDRTCRLIFDILKNNEIKTENNLFLIEFQDIGRQELYLNSFNDYISHNFRFNDDLSYDKGFLHKDVFDTIEDISELKSYDKIINDYNKLFNNFHIHLNYQDMLKQFLISYLKQKNVNFIIVSGMDDNIETLLNPKNYIVYDDKFDDIISYADSKKLLIKDVSDVDDFHISLEGNKLISNKIYDFIFKNYNNFVE